MVLLEAIANLKPFIAIPNSNQKRRFGGRVEEAGNLQVMVLKIVNNDQHTNVTKCSENDERAGTSEADDKTFMYTMDSDS